MSVKTINKFAQSDQLYSELTVENMPGGVFRGQILAKLVPFSVVKQFEYTKVIREVRKKDSTGTWCI